MAKLKVNSAGKQRLVECAIVDMNRLADTYTVKFKNGTVRNVPTNKIAKLDAIDEGVLDKLKSFGKELWDNIVEAGNYVYFKLKNWIIPATSPVISAIVCADKDNVNMYPSAALVDAGNELGYDVPAGDIEEDLSPDSTTEYVDFLNKFWKSVMDMADEGVEMDESYKAVKEGYKIALAKHNKSYLFESLIGQVNEAIDLKSNMEGVTDASFEEIQKMVFDRLKDRILNGDNVAKGETAPQLPLLIWGAPGIGKTSIIKDLIKRLNTEAGFKLSCIELTASRLYPDDFTLPNFITDKSTGEIKATDVPKSWLPVYKPAPISDPDKEEKDKEADAIANMGDGGIIFLDELSRVNPQTMNVLMTLIQGRYLGDLKLGSKWIVVSASNRKTDMGDHSDEFAWEKAWGGRFEQYNYVPTFPRWKEWAKSAGVDETILDFLTSHESYWYDLSEDNDKEHLTADPRGWTSFSDALHAEKRLRKDQSDERFNKFEKKYGIDRPMSKAEIIKRASGFVGSRAAQEYGNYLSFEHVFSAKDAQEVWELGDKKEVEFSTNAANIEQATKLIINNFQAYKQAAGFKGIPKYTDMTPEEFERACKFIYKMCGGGHNPMLATCFSIVTNMLVKKGVMLADIEYTKKYEKGIRILDSNRSEAKRDAKGAK